MKKNAKTLIILLAVLVVVIGAYVTVSLVNANKASDDAAGTEATQIYPADWDKPTQISYVADNAAMSFTLADSTWIYDGDPSFPLKQSILTGLVSKLSGLTAVREFEAPDALSDYGLDAPAYTVTTDDGGNHTLTLLIGNTTGDNYYAMKSDGSTIYTIDSSLVGALQTDILKMITLDTIPSLTETTIDKLTLTADGQTLTLDKYKARDESITWFIVEGETYTVADEYVLSDGTNGAPVYISDVLSALKALSFSSCAAFNPDSSALTDQGLTPPVLTLTADYTTTDSNQKETSGSVTLEIGRSLDDGSGYYARLAGSDQVNVLPGDNITPLLDALAAIGTPS